MCEKGGVPMKKYAGEVHNPLLYGGKTNWDAVVTSELPRKCQQCKWVYPPDDVNVPKEIGELCGNCQKGSCG